MALRAFYFIRILTKGLTYCYMERSQRHLLTASENNLLEALIRRPMSFGFPTTQFSVYTCSCVLLGTSSLIVRVVAASGVTREFRIVPPSTSTKSQNQE